VEETDQYEMMGEEYILKNKIGKQSSANVKKIVDRFAFFITLAVIGLYFSTGIYQVNSSEVALVVRFGKCIGVAQPGINYHLPQPFESIVKVDVKNLKTIEIGFRKTTAYIPNGVVYTSESDLISRNSGIKDYREKAKMEEEIKKESLMMTEDNNIANVECAIQYKISDPFDYAFNMKNPDLVLKNVAECVIRQKVAEHPLDEVLTSARNNIAENAKKSLQETVENYKIGISILSVNLQQVKPPQQVVAAFDDVNSAIQDKERKHNKALQYYNDIVPKAQGEASKTLQEAKAYKQIQILTAEGDIARFDLMLKNYMLAPEITKKRLYLENLEKILPGMNKIILSEKNQDNLNLLQLDTMFNTGVN